MVLNFQAFSFKLVSMTVEMCRRWTQWCTRVSNVLDAVVGCQRTPIKGLQRRCTQKFSERNCRINEHFILQIFAEHNNYNKIVFQSKTDNPWTRCKNTLFRFHELWPDDLIHDLDTPKAYLHTKNERSRSRHSKFRTWTGDSGKLFPLL